MAKEVMMSMRMAPEAGASLTNHHAPAPMAAAATESYSSNYKGVMLCDRPGIEVSQAAMAGAGDGGQAIPFLSAVSAPEQLGLNPIRKDHLGSSGKGPAQPKNVVLSNHKRWLHSLQMLKRQLAEEESYMALEEDAKKKRLADESKKVRDQIRAIKSAHHSADDVEGGGSQFAALNKEGMLAQLKGKFGKELVAEMMDRVAPEGTMEAAPAALAATEVRKPSAKAKPAWARTEEQQVEAEDEEVEDLLDFAENLDIDKYMDDYEFNEALAAAKARITELDEDLEDGSEVGDADEVGSQGTAQTSASMMSMRIREREEAAAAAAEEWDNRTNASHESARSRMSGKSRAVAQEMLEMNPNLRKMHSEKSLTTIVEKTMPMDDGAFDPTDQNKFGRCGVGAVRVAVHNDEDRLHRMDVKEGKDLPYLYRNPAV